ncbi:ATP-dependent nuclease [Candidatus Pristimantibacillus sp. PTI5]|uniref:ATP-dependent nuclease n=1 Tax=Candidatus Pristimantibacillus sp. PTI5 TaxID=3400422 RepID=UPI003B018A50
MIKKIRLQRFKKVKDQTFELKSEGITIIAGANNSGKSTLLHAMAVWEFCKTVILLGKGINSLLPGSNSQGVGLSVDEFLPVAIPSLKHLWTNLKTQKESSNDQDGYTLRICCYWDTPSSKECKLEFGLSLVNDRLFIKTTDSNLIIDDEIPTIAFLPTFAGITEKENRMSRADRSKQIGKGLAGSILRNMLLDMNIENKKKRDIAKGDRSKISSAKLNVLRLNDPWELLQKTLIDIFNCELEVQPFNDLYHNYIRVDLYKGRMLNNRFTKFPNYSKRDIMVEGSGFLQWLSVYSLALDNSVQILVLDEPDAHLHSSLQITLLNRLNEIAKLNNKQVLIATHSTEIIKNTKAESILHIKHRGTKYLTADYQKIGLLEGLGSEYSPKINQLQRCKKLLFVENESDANFLKIWCNTLNERWNENIVIWPTTYGHKERNHLFLELKKEIPDLIAVSLRDRDEENYNTVDHTLIDKIMNNNVSDIVYLKWRRRYIENYLLAPQVIARITGKSVEEIKKHFEEHHSLALNGGNTSSNVPSAINEARGKEIISTNQYSIEKTFGCDKHSIAKEMKAEEICDDVKTVITILNDKFSELVTQ